jgi:hypothetical protein
VGAGVLATGAGAGVLATRFGLETGFETFLEGALFLTEVVPLVSIKKSQDRQKIRIITNKDVPIRVNINAVASDIIFTLRIIFLFEC